MPMPTSKKQMVMEYLRFLERIFQERMVRMNELMIHTCERMYTTRYSPMPR